MSAIQDYHDVHMKMRQKTIDKVNKLQDRLGVENRTTAVKLAVDVTDMVARTIRKGGRVILEQKDGSKSVITIPTISNES